jgi:hypothetical protein
MEIELDNLIEDNEYNEKNETGMINQKQDEFKFVKKIGTDEQKKFEEERQVLEQKYQVLLEDNIRREREEKKEILKKRFKLADIRPNKKNEQESLKMEDEDIADRTPILDQLIDKWKHVIKYKKSMIERYQRNVYITELSFEKICNVKTIKFKKRY